MSDSKISSQKKSAVTRSANAAQTRQDIADTVDKALSITTQKRLNDEETVWALDRIAAGDTMMNITAQLGVSRAALYVRAYDDPDGFGRKLASAMEIGTFQRLENAENMLLNGELSTGDPIRDREYMKYAQWMASRLNRKVFGERALIDTKGGVTIVLPDINPDAFD